jgi:hypothetical protein
MWARINLIFMLIAATATTRVGTNDCTVFAESPVSAIRQQAAQLVTGRAQAINFRIYPDKYFLKQIIS